MKKHGFTLIELLVVISIIAIMAAILFPVFSKAREKARQTNCVSNLKQIALGVNMYHQDYDAYPPQYTIDSKSAAPAGGWWDKVGVTYWPQMVYSYTKSLSLFGCPSSTQPNGDSKHGFAYANYGCNGQIMADAYYGYATVDESQVVHPADAYLVFDSGGYALNGFYLLPTGQKYAQSFQYLPGQGSAGIKASTAITANSLSDYNNGRHNGGNCVAFCDGHAKWMRADAMVAEAEKPQFGAWNPLN